MRAGKWLNEEDYEVNYFPVAKQARILRDENPNWTLSLFRPVKGHVYVSPNTEPPSVSLLLFLNFERKWIFEIKS